MTIFLPSWKLLPIQEKSNKLLKRLNTIFSKCRVRKGEGTGVCVSLVTQSCPSLCDPWPWNKEQKENRSNWEDL